MGTDSAIGVRRANLRRPKTRYDSIQSWHGETKGLDPHGYDIMKRITYSIEAIVHWNIG